MTFKLLFKNDVKPHLISGQVYDAVVSDLNQRFGADRVRADVRSGLFRLDLGGAMAVDALWIPVKLGELVLEVPFRDLQDLYMQLSTAVSRGGGFYKLHGANHIVAVSAAEREQILTTWRLGLQRISLVAAAERQDFARRIAVVNADLKPSFGAGLN